MSLPPIRFVQIATHSRCNASCLFCPWEESEHAKHPGMMSDELWARVLDCLLPFSDGINQGKVCPYLMQEPLIDKTIFGKIDDIYRVFPGTLVEVSTNGAALTDNVIEQLFSRFDGRRHDLWVSHHGIDADSLRRIMQIDYNRTTANLIHLIKQSNGRFTIRIRGAGQSRDGKHVIFTRDQYLGYWENMANEHGLNMQNVHVDGFTFHDRAGQLHRTDRGANLLNVGKVREIGPSHPFHCGRIDQWVHIQHDGSLRICCMDYHREVKLPTLKDVTLVEYFESDAYRALVAKVTGKMESEENFICKKCISPGG